MADIKISEMTTAATLNGTEVSVLSQSQGGQLVSVKATLQAIANWFAVNAEYTSALNTTDKRICGAINELKQLISLIPQFSIEVVETLPTEDISDTTIYLVPAEDPEVGNYYEEYIHVNNSWELVGTTAVDLSGYYTKVESDGKFAVTISNTISPTTTTKKVADIKQNNVTTPVYADDADAILRAAFGEHTVTGNPVSVDAFLGLEVASECKVTMNPIQDLSHGAPSPANICPISGRNSVTVTRTGKNLAKTLNGEYATGFGTNVYANGYNDFTITGKEGGFTAPANSSNSVMLYLGQLIAGTYTLTFNKTVSTINSRVRKSTTKEFPFTTTNETSNTQNTTITFTADGTSHYWLNCFASNVAYDYSNVQLEQGTATAYEPYQGETHTHNYASTVYGGVDDFVSGEGKRTHSYLSYDSFTRTNDHQFYKNVGSQIASRYGRNNIICDRMPTATSSIPTGTAVNAVHTNSSGAIVVHTEEAYSTASAFITAMGGQLNFAVRTSAGADITNTPEDITLLKGVNVVSTDGDNLELKYSADIKAYIDSRLA